MSAAALPAVLGTIGTQPKNRRLLAIAAMLDAQGLHAEAEDLKEVHKLLCHARHVIADFVSKEPGSYSRAVATTTVGVTAIELAWYCRMRGED